MDDVGAGGIFFTDSELELVRTAPRLLLSTLGREEAEGLEDVRALIAKIDNRAA